MGTVPPSEVGGISVDRRTVFIRNLAFSTDDEKLEATFSEVGPIRQSFIVKQKGSEQHKGFGFVQFALVEDAEKAVKAKHGALLDGRQIQVEVAKKRAPLEERRKKPRGDSKNPAEADGKQEAVLPHGDKDTAGEFRTAVPGGEVTEGGPTSAPDNAGIKRKGPGEGNKLQEEASRKKHRTDARQGSQKATDKSKSKAKEEGRASDMQRPARTVVLGGLDSPAMVAEVLKRALRVGPTESIQNPFSELLLTQRGLSRDGCKAPAVAVVYASVKSATQAVAALHGQQVAGGTVWARQLGGEGAKAKRHRLIVRNLPFQVSEEKLRELFSPAGFVWEVAIPKSADGRARGFAFVGFMSQAHAEKALQTVNGVEVNKRPIAVDWAVPKKLFKAAAEAAAPAAAKKNDHLSDLEDSESDEEYEEKGLSNGATGKLSSQGSPLKKLRTDVPSPKTEIPAVGSAVSCGQEGDEEFDFEEDRRHDEGTRADRNVPAAREADIMRLIAEKVMATAGDLQLDFDDEDDSRAMLDPVQGGKAKLGTQGVELPDEKVNKGKANQKRDEREQVAAKDAKQAVKGTGDSHLGKKGKREGPSETATNNNELAASTGKKGPAQPEQEGLKAKDEDKKSREVFVRNLPPDVTVPLLRERFQKFGSVQACRLVLHPITKRPKGTAFIEFGTSSAAEAAILAGQTATSGGSTPGVAVGGRQVAVSLAVGKDEARKLGEENGKQVRETDRRNLYLAQEGLIREDAAAARGMSKADIARRKRLQAEKASKLASPNFVVSRTRLAVHNIPKDMTEQPLKELFITAVKQRATKQHPVIKQVKILYDENKKGPDGGSRSRGAAFVEFTEHQHALVALRALNNNPDTFGREHRPIVEFAIENQLILRKREAMMAQAKLRCPKEKEGRGRDLHMESGHAGNPDEKPSRADRKRKRKEDQKKTSGYGVSDHGEGKGNIIGVAKKSSQQNEGGKARENVDQPNGAGKVGNRPVHAGLDRKLGAQNASRSKENASRQKGPHPKKSTHGEAVTSSKNNVVRGDLTANLPIGELVSTSERKLSRRERKSTHSTAGEDNLDKLMAQYRNRYFEPSVNGVSVAGKESKSSLGDLRRWFEK